MIDIERTFGALLIGCIVAAVFSGIVTAQTFAYFKNYPKDKRSLKIMVGTVWFLDFWHTIFISASIWDHLIAHFGEESRIDYIPWSLALSIVFTAVLTFIVHLFFVHRIYRLSQKSLLLAGPLFLIACARLCFACLTTVTMITLKSLEKFVQQYTWSFTCGLTLSSALDIFIVALMIIMLRRRQNTTSEMNRVLDKLVLYTFETGTLTCAVAVTSLICWLANKRNLVFMGLHFIISKTYANSLLATLNTRRGLREESTSSSRSKRKKKASKRRDKNRNAEGEEGVREEPRRRRGSESDSDSGSEGDTGLRLYLANIPGMLTNVRDSLGRIREGGRGRNRGSFGTSLGDNVTTDVGGSNFGRAWRGGRPNRRGEWPDITSFGVEVHNGGGVSEDLANTHNNDRAHLRTQTFQLESIIEGVGHASGSSTYQSRSGEHASGVKGDLTSQSVSYDRESKPRPVEEHLRAGWEEHIALNLSDGSSSSRIQTKSEQSLDDRDQRKGNIA